VRRPVPVIQEAAAAKMNAPLQIDAIRRTRGAIERTHSTRGVLPIS
jgi:hypothetical protein